MCDSRCTGARPGSPCHCECRGANHGSGSRQPKYPGRYPKHPAYVPPRHTPIQPRTRPQSLGEYFSGVGKSALTGALIYGLSAAVPPFGAVAIPAYTAYNYSKLAYNLYKVYD